MSYYNLKQERKEGRKERKEVRKEESKGGRKERTTDKNTDKNNTRKNTDNFHCWVPFCISQCSGLNIKCYQIVKQTSSCKFT